MEKEKLALLAEIISLLKARLPESQAAIGTDPLQEKAISDDLIKREAARLILGVSHKTFSRHIDGRLIKPVCLLGTRKMYSKKEVYGLIDRRGGMNYRSM
ncbi:hypothetical protein SAMN05216436_101342 [bacterium A37T11]|nr:hypothetical protein SAMN05216436_101342 [bacterium A37T11]